MDLNSWIELYEKKTGDKFKKDERFTFVFLPDKGFCEIGVSSESNMILLNNVCGEGKFWKMLAESIGESRGITHFGTMFIRKGIKAYIRNFGYKIQKEVTLLDGQKRYFCLDKISNKPATVSPAYNEEDKLQAYFITWEI